MAEMNLGDGIDLLQKRARIVKWLMIVGFAVTAAMLAGEIGEIKGAIDITNPNPSLAERLYFIVLIANTVIALTTIVFFAMWIYRAAANIVAANVPGFDFTPGWAVGWYFIPFANLVMPFRAMRQIWNASGANSGDIDRGDPTLTIWWTLWLTSNIAANFSLQMSFRATTAEMLELALYLGALSSVLSLALFIAGTRLVERITDMQRDRLSPGHIFS